MCVYINVIVMKGFSHLYIFILNYNSEYLIGAISQWNSVNYIHHIKNNNEII